MTSIELRFTFKRGETSTRTISSNDCKRAEFFFPKTGWMSIEHSEANSVNDEALIRESTSAASLSNSPAHVLKRGDSQEYQTGNGKLVISHLPGDVSNP